MQTKNIFLEIYEFLFAIYGPQKWWPGDGPFEMLVGAILTQNTNWQNVTKAIENLKNRQLLSFCALEAASHQEIATAIKPSGYYNIKTQRLKNLLTMIRNCYSGKLEDLLADSTENARSQLLGVKGIGPETADSILLYGGGHPIFVVDAYTHRIFSRHQLVPEESYYEEIQDIFMDSLPIEAQLFNEYHALIVRIGKNYCKKNRPLCESCPLQKFLHQ